MKIVVLFEIFKGVKLWVIQTLKRVVQSALERPQGWSQYVLR